MRRCAWILVAMIGGCGGGENGAGPGAPEAPAQKVTVKEAIPLRLRPEGEGQKGWRAEGTNQAGPVARWELEQGVLRLVDPGQGARPTFHLCWTDTVRFRDGTLEVKVKAGEGEIDRGGGPIWRVQDKDHYYVARWNPLEDNFRVYKVVAAERIQLASADVKADPAAWHTIRVRHVGSRIECSFDGEKLLEATDDALPGEGGVGVWAKADARTAFKDPCFVR